MQLPKQQGLRRRSGRVAAAIAAGAALIAGAAGVTALTAHRALSSDHADTPEIAMSPGVDLTDVFMFPSAENSNNVVLVMCVHPLVPTGQGSTVSFDPDALYQFKIDNTGDSIEDLVIQARFSGTGAGQKVLISGPNAPAVTGTVSQALPAYSTEGTINQTFSPTSGIKVFAGAREDPFFFDLERFFAILPDRATPVTGQAVAVAQANVPQLASWRSAADAKDFLAGLNLLAIVVEVPKSQLRGTTNGKIAVWCTTSK